MISTDQILEDIARECNMVRNGKNDHTFTKDEFIIIRNTIKALKGKPTINQFNDIEGKGQGE